MPQKLGHSVKLALHLVLFENRVVGGGSQRTDNGETTRCPDIREGNYLQVLLLGEFMRTGHLQSSRPSWEARPDQMQKNP